MQKWKLANSGKSHEVRLKHSQTATDAIKTAAHNSTDPRASGFEDWPVPENNGDTSRNEAWAAQLDDGANLDGISVQSGHGLATKFSGRYKDRHVTTEKANRYGDYGGSPYGRNRSDFGKFDEAKGVVDETDEQPRMRGKGSRWNANR